MMPERRWGMFLMTAIGISNRVFAFLAGVDASIDIDAYVLAKESDVGVDSGGDRKCSGEQSDGRVPELIDWLALLSCISSRPC